MRWTRLTAAIAFVGVLVLAPAPAARRADDGPRVSGTAELPAALNRMYARADRDQIDRILDTVGNHARRFDVDPTMILAVIHVESRFDARAVSSKGAMGLMQLRPATAREVAEELAIDWTTDERLFDPDFNILLGTCYLRSLLDRFENRDTALAAYNSGPTRVSELRRRTGIVPRDYPNRVAHAVGRFAAL